MRICFVTHKVLKGDGQGRVNYEVIVKALKEGHQVIVISSELSEDLQNHSSVEWIKIQIPKLPTVLLRYQLFAIVSAFSIWLRKNSIDLIVANGFITYARSDINCVHFVHSAWVKSSYHPIRQQKDIRTMYQFVYNRLNSMLERFALKRSRYIIAVSEQVKHELVLDAKMTEHRISVIHNGVDIGEFYPRQMNRNDYGLDEDTIYALFAGDLNSGTKNLDNVLHAVHDVEGVHLLVLGNAERSRYPKIAEQLGIGHRVHFLGYRKDVADIMSLADLFIFPSRYESFSLVILEAMASGLPVIMSNRCGVAELISDGAAVIIDDPEDREGLVRVLRELVTDPERLKAMALQARDIAVKNHWGVMADKYMNIFNQIVNPLSVVNKVRREALK